MKIVKFGEAQKFSNSDKCIGYEYELNDKDINCATAIISGRYPDSGYCYNENCKELIYVIQGTGIIKIKDKESISFKEKDVILINKGEIYYWSGDFMIVMPCIPAWYPEQHKFID